MALVIAEPHRTRALSDDPRNQGEYGRAKYPVGFLRVVVHDQVGKDPKAGAKALRSARPFQRGVDSLHPNFLLGS